MVSITLFFLSLSCATKTYRYGNSLDHFLGFSNEKEVFITDDFSEEISNEEEKTGFPTSLLSSEYNLFSYSEYSIL